MAIGTSLGAYFPDELSFHMNSFVDQGDGVSSPTPSVKKDNNEVSPDSITDTKELRDPNKPVTVSDMKTASPLVTITDKDIDTGIGLAEGFSGGGLATKSPYPKGYLEAVPMEQKLSRTGVSHPGIRFDVIDPKAEGKVIRDGLTTRTGASRSVDRLDNKYGAYRYRVEPRRATEGELTDSERDFIKNSGLDWEAE